MRRSRFAHANVTKSLVAVLICSIGAAAHAAPKPPVQPLVPTSQPLMRPLPVMGFREIHVTVSGFAARIDWAPYAGAVPAAQYQIIRTGGLPVPAATVPAAITSYTDATLRDNTTYTYQVKAIGAPRPIFQGAGVPTGANQQAGSLPGVVLDSSNPVTITIAPLLPPRSVTAAVNPANPNSFNVSWAPVPGAQTYNVVRSGIFVGRFTGPFTDTPPRTGWYNYQVATVVSESGGEGVSALSVPVSIHNGPFTIVAFGDSIMWGQGIADAHKFTTLVKDSLRSSLGQAATVTSFAHSGATISTGDQLKEADTATAYMKSPATLGEVPNSFPSIPYQAKTMAPLVLDPASVDLIIMDGCANDVNVTTVLNPTSKDPDLAAAAVHYCGDRMMALLQDIRTKYTRAKIVVIGYYPMVSNFSDVTFLNALATAVGVPAASIAGLTGGSIAPLVGIPIDPATGSIIGAIAGAIASAVAPAAYRDVATDHSNIFAATSTMQLQVAVASQGSSAVRFAPLPLQPINAYASPATWLWLIPTPAYPPMDEMFAPRLATCSSLHLATADSVECVEASMGHPNPIGAQQYAMSIENQVMGFLNEWRSMLASPQTASQ